LDHSLKEVRELASNQEAAINNAKTPQEVAAAYDAYRQSMVAKGQTPKPLSSFGK